MMQPPGQLSRTFCSRVLSTGQLSWTFHPRDLPTGQLSWTFNSRVLSAWQLYRTFHLRVLCSGQLSRTFYSGVLFSGQLSQCQYHKPLCYNFTRKLILHIYINIYQENMHTTKSNEHMESKFSHVRGSVRMCRYSCTTVSYGLETLELISI